MAPLGELLKKFGLTLAVAESCSGGLLAATLTDLPGASDVFLGGFVTYTYAAKTGLLGIPGAVLESHGAVSEKVAGLMAEAARVRLGADLGLGITGVAGPGRQEGKPVGLIYVAASLADMLEVRELRLGTGRASNRIAAVEGAIALGTEVVSANRESNNRSVR